MRRRPLTILSAASIVALAVVLFAWATSYHRYCIFSYDGRVHLLMLDRDSGVDHWLRVVPMTVHRWSDLRTRTTIGIAGVEFCPATSVERHEFTYFQGAGKIGSFVKLRYRLLALPYWLIALALILVPLAQSLAALRRRRRVRGGLCPDCGYDLRASSGRCPECGREALRSIG